MLLPDSEEKQHSRSLWHSGEGSLVAQQLGVDPKGGLSTQDVIKRLTQYGHNLLAERTPRPAWMKLLDQFRGVLVLILMAAAVLAGALGDLKDAAVITIVVVANALLGFFQERRAEAALDALKNMLAPTARVRRDGQVAVVRAAELVPGDVLLLESGDRIAADARVLAAHSAEVAEAALTGESHPVGKSADAVAPEAVLAERNSMVFMNTVVTRGRIEAVVVCTGMQTEMGRLAGMLAETAEARTPLQVQLDRLGHRLALIAGVVVALIFGLGFWQGSDLVTTAMTAIALAVAAIPEGLPAVVTVTLALGMHRMAKRHAIVKKLSAVETLGCTTVICSDKTGTLTLNQMTAREFYFAGRLFEASGQGYGQVGEIKPTDEQSLPNLAPLLTPAALCSDSRIHDGELIGDPTEGALLALAAKGGVEPDELAAHSPRIAEIPFDSAHKFMATFHYEGANVRMWVKGAPDVLLRRAVSYLTADAKIIPLEGDGRAGFENQAQRMGSNAMRVIALAGRTIPAQQFDPAGDLMAWADELTLIGLVGIIDPPRPEAREAIRVCREAGVQVKMITGDHGVTAAAIARELGLTGEVHEGRELDALNAEEVASLVERTGVFSRVAPEHKVRIVEALKARGHVVAMTGDGINDAPALKTANIGVAMGITGTDVTKEAATLVLTDDNFATIVKAVKEGRTIYDNIVKFVRFQLSTNIGAILTVLGAPLFGIPTPLTAIQILWVNIIMDGPPAMTLGVEPARQGIMEEPPRSSHSMILDGRRLVRVAAYGLTMAVGTLSLYAWGEAHGGHAYAVTLAFTTFVLFQFFNIFNARAEHGTAFNRQFFANGKLWLALVAVLLLQGVAVHWQPAQELFDTVDLAPRDWALAVAVASTVLFLEEARKLLLRTLKRTGRSFESPGASTRG